MNFRNNNDTLVYALGGLLEVGKNMYCVECGNEIIITDVGITFPNGEVPGVDYILPDFSYLKKNERKVKALFITHGHEDHIGGIPFLLEYIDIKAIYAPNQAAGLIRKKLEDKGIKYNNLYTYTDKTKVKFKNISVEFFRTTHSIPDSHGIVINTPNGKIVTTGDFKFDLTPIGPMADLHKIARIGESKVTLLLSDSTNALNTGMSTSETKVDETLGEIFLRHKGRIIIATFASNIYRLKHIVDTCKKNKRKIAVFGRSMENNLEISLNDGYIKHREIFVTPEEANKLDPKNVCLLCTGSQGEPLAALSRIANGTHRQIKLQDDDLVVLSSSAIPGNALAISKTINKLYLRGVKVCTNSSLTDVHTSGHGYQEELKLMLRLIKPKYFMPFHGEYRMLKQHADLAIECGIPKENTFVCKNGDVLVIRKGKVIDKRHIPVGDIYVDGNRIGEISSAVMYERKSMSQDGIILVVANIDTAKKELLGDINITTRGFVFEKENQDIIDDVKEKATSIINESIKRHVVFSEVKNNLITELSEYLNKTMGRRPVITPIMIDIKKGN